MIIFYSQIQRSRICEVIRRSRSDVAGSSYRSCPTSTCGASVCSAFFHSAHILLTEKQGKQHDVVGQQRTARRRRKTKQRQRTCENDATHYEWSELRFYHRKLGVKRRRESVDRRSQKRDRRGRRVILERFCVFFSLRSEEGGGVVLLCVWKKVTGERLK